MDTYEKKYKEIVGQLKKAYLYAQTDSTKAVLEEIFPELKESKDEKIRKAIIATIHLYYGEPLEDEAKEMLAWLEKQGEQKPFDYENANIQQKDFAPKQEWSEEDEMMLEDSMRAIECSNYFDFESSKENVLNWLNSLKQRIGG